MHGTIIFYNTDTGLGLILSSDKEKYKFNIESWDDMDNLPKIGLKVSFSLQDGIAQKIQKLLLPKIFLQIYKKQRKP